MKKDKKELRKELAVKILKDLKVYEPYVNAFKNRDQITMFERFAGFYMDPECGFEDEHEIMKQIKELEEKYDLTVYAVTHEIFAFGECYTCLVVTNDEIEEDPEWIVETPTLTTNSMAVAYAYVINVTEPMFSEFGSVLLKSWVGGLARYE